MKITTRAYANIENNLADITLNRLSEIAAIFECSPIYIYNFNKLKNDFYNIIHNNTGNQGLITIDQRQQDFGKELYELQKELLECQRKRIALLETLLKVNDIIF